MGVIFKKYTLLFFHQSVYLCQGMFNTALIRLPINMSEAGVLVLVVGVSILVIKLIASWIKNSSTHKQLCTLTAHNIIVEKLSNELDLQNKVLICQNNHPFAFCFGFINPKIYLSTGLVKILSKKEIEAVLRHENYHLKNKDAMVGFFATIAQSLFPFLPIISDIAKHHRIQNEIAADKSATMAMRSSKPLISVLRKIVAYEPIKPFALTAFLAEWDSLEIRIKKLVNQKTNAGKIPTRNVLLSLLSIFTLSVLVITPVRAFELHAKNEDALVLCGPYQTCNNICKAQVVASYSHI